MRSHKELTPLGRKASLALADALGDTPEAVISGYQLRAGLCRAYVAGEPSRFAAAAVRNADMPDEPMGFGGDPEALWGLLKGLDGLKAVSVAAACAEALGGMIERGTGRKVTYDGDLYCVLEAAPPEMPDPAVRRLGPADLDLVMRAAPELKVTGMCSPETMLAKGIAVGAVVDGRLAANAHTSAISALYADIGVYTLDEYRGRGFATATAALLSRLIMEAGRTPVWSCGEGNVASVAIAKKLGFRQTSRRVYIILGQ